MFLTPAPTRHRAAPFRTPAAALRRRGFAAIGLSVGLALGLQALPEARAAVTIGAQVTGMEAAENSIQTTAGRIFVSANGNLFELSKSAAGVWSKLAVPVYHPPGTTAPPPCYYLGLTEYANTLYSVCTEDSADSAAPKHLMALDLTVAGASIRSISALNNFGLPNGLASDGTGNLLFANTALPVLGQTPLIKPGNIWRIQLSGRFAVAGQALVPTPATHTVTALNPNGMKFHGGKLYVTANPPMGSGTSQLVRIPVTSAGTLGTPFTLYNSATFLDDFSLVQGGMVIVEWLNGTVKFINEASGVLRTYTYPLSLPTSATALKAGTAPGKALLVTLGGSDRAVFLETDWPIEPR